MQDTGKYTKDDFAVVPGTIVWSVRKGSVVELEVGDYGDWVGRDEVPPGEQGVICWMLDEKRERVGIGWDLGDCYWLKESAEKEATDAN